MFKTIFSRLLIASLSVLLISFILMGTILFGYMGNYLIAEKSIRLKEVAAQVSDMTTFMQIENQGLLYNRAYQNNINAIASFSGSHIIVVNYSGDVFATDQSLSGVKTIDKSITKDVLDGKQVELTDNLGGIYNTNVFTIGYPILYNGEIVGGVFLSVTSPEVDKIRYSIISAFILSAAVLILIAFIVIYFLSKRLTSPIKSINIAAKNIAAGNFDSRVNINSKDEIGQLAETFNYMADSLSQLEYLQSNFIANVSHELRTPMTSIGGFIESIMDGTIPPSKQNEYINVVSSEIQRLSRLVSDMLDISKMSIGEFHIDMKSFDINELIRLSIIKFEQYIEDKNLNIKVNFEQDPITVLADYDAISRVLTNLLDNAIKFSNQGGLLEINVSIQTKKAHIAISNTGIGIEKQDESHIWDRFYKTDKSRSKDKSGAGLGLYMVKNILGYHGENIFFKSIDANIETDSTPLKKTTFTFTLELS